MPFVGACLHQVLEMVFDAHHEALAFYPSTCQRSIYDNIRIAVDTLLIGREPRALVQPCLAMASLL